MAASNIVRRVDNEFDKGIYVNRTLKAYEWSREEDGEWKKGPPKNQQYRVYTNPPALAQKRRHKFGGDLSSILSGDIDEEDVSLTNKMPIEGPPTSWYKRNGKWKQMKIDELGYIDPDSFYGKIVDKMEEEKSIGGGEERRPGN